MSTLPQADRPIDDVQGHWLLARLGKRVLRPGGLELTTQLLDEAHLFAGEHAGESNDGTRTRSLLAQSIRMTGKYGVGWMFVTQTLHDFDKTILRQLQAKLLSQVDAKHARIQRTNVHTRSFFIMATKPCTAPAPSRSPRSSKSAPTASWGTRCPTR